MPRRKKVFISGPMTGIPEYNRSAFYDAAEFQRQLNRIVLNPATLPLGLDEPEYMQISLAMLLCCDCIYLIDGWEQSSGARSEYTLAQKLDLEIIHQNGQTHDLTIGQLTG